MENISRRPAFASVLLATLVSALNPQTSRADDSASLDGVGETSLIGANQPVEPWAFRLLVTPPKRGLGASGAVFGAVLGGLTAQALLSADGAGGTPWPIGVAALAAVASGAMGRTRGPEEPRVGEEVRGWDNGPVQGAFQRADGSGVLLRLADGTERKVPYGNYAFEVRRSTRLTGPGAVAGVMATGGIALLYVAYCDDCSGSLLPAALVFSAVGAAGGAIIGTLVRVHDWRPLSPERSATRPTPHHQMAFGLAPTRGRGLRAQFSFRWR